VKRLESTAPLATPTLRSEAGPTLTAVRGVTALCAVIGAWMVAPPDWWPFALAVSIVLGLLSTGDLGRMARHAFGGVEWAIKRDLNGDGQIGAVRVVKEFVYVGGGEPTEVLDTGGGQVDPDDLRCFIDRLNAVGERGPVWRDWIGARLPSGQVISEYDDFLPLVTPLVKIKAITGRGERSAGKVAMDKAEIKRRLKL
jgi:hypothetical protein